MITSISSTTNGPSWITIGDFNEIRAPDEGVGQGVCSHGGPGEFIAATEASYLMEFPFHREVNSLGTTTLQDQ